MLKKLMAGVIVAAIIVFAAYAIWAGTRPGRSDIVLPDSTDLDRLPRAVRLGRPRAILGTETMLLPVQYGTGYEASTVSSPGRYAFEPMVNAVFLRSTGASLLLDRPARIASALLPDSLVIPSRTWIAYEIAFEDTNGDDVLNHGDGRTLALSSIEGTEFRVALPANVFLDAYHVLTPDTILVYAFSEPPPRRGRPDERRQWAFIYSVGAGSLTPVETADELVAQAARILAN
jgi:hypothetical protein